MTKRTLALNLNYLYFQILQKTSVVTYYALNYSASRLNRIQNKKTEVRIQNTRMTAHDGFSDYSVEGFLGKDESLLSMVHDDWQVVERYHTTHAEIADTLERFMANPGLLLYPGYEYEKADYYTMENQSCPWGCDKKGQDWGVIRYLPQPNTKITITKLLPHLIKEHYFFEGRESPYRADPEILIRALNLGSHGEKMVALFIEKIKHPNDTIRRFASEILGNVGCCTTQVVPALIGSLDDPCKLVVKASVKSLGNIGHQAQEAVPHLIKMFLQDTSHDLRCCAAQALLLIGFGKGTLAEKLPSLVECLRDKDVQIRSYALELLDRVGTEASVAIPSLFYLLKKKDGDELTKRLAAKILSTIAQNETSIVPQLVNVLKSRNKLVRESAAIAILEIGSPAIPELTHLIDRDWRQLILATHFFIMRTSFCSCDDIERYYKHMNFLRSHGISYDEERILPVVMAAFKYGSRKIQKAAMKVLAEVNPQDGNVLPLLCEALKDKDAKIRTLAAETFAHIKDQFEDSKPFFCKALQDKNENVRNAAEDAVPLLCKALQDKNEEVRNAAQWALNKIAKHREEILPYLWKTLLHVAPKKVVAEIIGDIKYPSALPILMEALDDQEGDIVKYAAHALSKMGDKALPAVPKLIALLKKQDADWWGKCHAVEALGNIGQEAKAAISALIGAVSDQNPFVRSQAIVALDKIGGVHSAIPAWIAALEDSDDYVRFCAMSALMHIETRIPCQISMILKAVQAEKEESDCCLLAAKLLERLTEKWEDVVLSLIRSLHEEDPGIRVAAAKILYYLGEKAEASIPALIDTLSDCHVEVRSSAIRALSAMGQLARNAVPHIIKILQQHSVPDEVKYAATDALNRIPLNPENEEWDTAFLMKALADDILVETAVEILGRLGPRVLQELSQVLTDTRPAVKKAAVRAVYRIAKSSQQAVPVLLKAFNDTDPAVAMLAARVLTSLGKELFTVLTKLADGFRSQDRNVRVHALYALQNIPATAFIQIEPRIISTLMDSLLVLLTTEETEARQEPLQALLQLTVYCPLTKDY